MSLYDDWLDFNTNLRAIEKEVESILCKKFPNVVYNGNIQLINWSLNPITHKLEIMVNKKPSKELVNELSELIGVEEIQVNLPSTFRSLNN